MAPFIKFKKKDTSSVTGRHTELHFVNADCIFKAIYDTGSKTLSIFLDNYTGVAEYVFTGKEAEEALAVLQKL